VNTASSLIDQSINQFIWKMQATSTRETNVHRAGRPWSYKHYQTTTISKKHKTKHTQEITEKNIATHQNERKNINWR